MWIRSQDKMVLIETNDIYFNCEDDKTTGEWQDFILPISKINRNEDRNIRDVAEGLFKVERLVYKKIYVFNNQLGTYSTKEKALKVLDMIQKFKDEEPKFIEGEAIGVNAILAYINYNYRRTFQMPLDSEV